MLFTIQTYLEDYLQKRNIADPDSYAVRVANLYYQNRASLPGAKFLGALHSLRTLLFITNHISDRPQFESDLLRRLDSRFKKKAFSSSVPFPGGTTSESRKLTRMPRLTIQAILHEFEAAIEARAIDVFWLSRRKGKLRSRPEAIAQGLFATFSKGVLRDRGHLLREFASGVGFVDVGVIIAKRLHLVEFKVLKDGFTGPAQLAVYMANEARHEAHLVVIDARAPSRKQPLPARVSTKAGTVLVRRIDINPTPPSRA